MKKQDVPCHRSVARKFDAPAGVKSIEWRLLTNRIAAHLDATIGLIDWCRACWEIEMLFNILKNACRIEALQLGSVERLKRALALVVAGRNALSSHKKYPPREVYDFYDNGTAFKLMRQAYLAGYLFFAIEYLLKDEYSIMTTEKLRGIHLWN